MEKITIDEEMKNKILKYIKQDNGFYGYEGDITLLDDNGQLTESLARKVFTKIMTDAQRARTILKPDENNEFKKQIEEAFAKYDAIPKPEQLEKYGFYDGAYRNMELDEVYSNMQTAFELRELDNKYYTCKDLRNIADTAINSINGIDKYKISVKPEVYKELQKIKEELQWLLAEDRTDIRAIQDRVDKYNGHAIDIWNDYLTDVNDTNNNEYRWVAHNLTKGVLEGKFRDKYMSGSLMTNKIMGRYGNSDYGLIIKPKHIVAASYKDTYTLNIREDEERLFNIRPPIMLPQEIEEICIQQTIEKNGEMLNYEKEKIYPEVVMDEFEIEGVYYISNGEQELARDYDRARKVADERGVPLKERDVSKYRTKLGLEPMTEIAKKNLCTRILRKCCEGDEKLKEKFDKFSKNFVDEHFQEFADKYLQLKEKDGFSKEDILKLFSEFTREDRHFGKISENIDVMYLTPEEIEKAQATRAMQKYGLTGITNVDTLKERILSTISEGIIYSADPQDSDKWKKFVDIKRVLPQFDEFKKVYSQLRLEGLEDNLYQNIDFGNISYDALLNRATRILEENMKKQPKDEKEPDSDKIIINEFGEIIREIDSESTVPKQDSVTFEEIIPQKSNKELKQPYPEKIRPREEAESIKDEIGDRNDGPNDVQMKEVKTPSVNFWMNRFSSCYSAIGRVTQNAKNRFVKMKSDIVKAISEKLKERMSDKQENNKQNQDPDDKKGGR